MPLGRLAVSKAYGKKAAGLSKVKKAKQTTVKKEVKGAKKNKQMP
jgi:hypothetical protein